MSTVWSLLAFLLGTASGAALPWAARHFAPDAAMKWWTGAAAMAAATTWAAQIVPLTSLLLVTVPLAWALLLLALVDFAVLRLPDLVTLPLTLAGLLVSWLMPVNDFPAHLAGACVGFAALWLVAFFYSRMRGREGLGLGDAKLAAAAGAWLGVWALPSTILVAALGGLALVALAAARRGRAAFSEPVPFGVPLSLAIWLIWLYGALPGIADMS